MDKPFTVFHTAIVKQGWGLSKAKACPKITKDENFWAKSHPKPEIGLNSYSPSPDQKHKLSKCRSGPRYMKSTWLPLSSSIFIILQSVRIILPIFQKGEAAYLSACLNETKINSINLMVSRKGTAYLNYSILCNINRFPRNSCVPDLAKSIHN